LHNSRQKKHSEASDLKKGKAHGIDFLILQDVGVAYTYVSRLFCVPRVRLEAWLREYQINKKRENINKKIGYHLVVTDSSNLKKIEHHSVKRIPHDSKQGLKAFISEVATIGRCTRTAGVYEHDSNPSTTRVVGTLGYMALKQADDQLKCVCFTCFVAGSGMR
jgi:hypothetical protein